MTLPFEGAVRDWKFNLSFIIACGLFWYVQYFYQLMIAPRELNQLAGTEFVRSFAFTGATLIGLALLSSIVFKFYPKYARHWKVRRALGVMGFVFVFLHVASVTQFVFGGNPAGIYWSLNPLENPLVWGAIAFPLFFVMALTSFDFALEKLGGVWWKAIHRIVYFAYLFSVLHYLTTNPPAWMSPPGYLLLLITFLVLAGQLYWFYQTTKRAKFQTLGFKIGVGIILLWLILLYWAFSKK